MTERLSIVMLKAKLYRLKEQFNDAKLNMMFNPNQYDNDFIREVDPIIRYLESDIKLLEEETK